MNGPSSKVRATVPGMTHLSKMAPKGIGEFRFPMVEFRGDAQVSPTKLEAEKKRTSLAQQREETMMTAGSEATVRMNSECEILIVFE